MERGVDSLLSPFILATNLVFLLWSEVVLDVERLADLFRGLSLDHVGNGLATHIEQRLNIKVVGGLQFLYVSLHPRNCKKEQITVLFS